MPGMLSPCKKVVWLISAPVERNSTRRQRPATSTGRNMRCQHCSTAPGPAAARLYVLGGSVIQQASAVLVVLHRTTSFVHQLMQQGAANFTQITGKNGVKVLLGGAGGRKIAQQR